MLEKIPGAASNIGRRLVSDVYVRSALIASPFGTDSASSVLVSQRCEQQAVVIMRLSCFAGSSVDPIDLQLSQRIHGQDGDVAGVIGAVIGVLRARFLPLVERRLQIAAQGAPF